MLKVQPIIQVFAKNSAHCAHLHTKHTHQASQSYKELYYIIYTRASKLNKYQ